jgi:ferric-dicitrate binding protein FerR (iron transport regulator)
MSNDGSRRVDSDTERTLRSLFAHVRPRDLPPAGYEAEIRRALFAEWNALTGRRVLARRAMAASVAAAMLAIVAALLLRTGAAPTAVVASVERVRGDVETGAVLLALGGDVASGARVDTHSGQVALRLAGGGSLRLGPRTRLTFAAAGRATLDEGTLYFDSEGAVAAPLEIRTAVGTVRDMGTQFVARLAGDRLEVGVRDGRVAIARGADSVDVEAGERVSVTGGAAQPRRERLAPFGAEWDWAERLAPPFAIDGRRLIDFLGWVEAQTGRTLVFADDSSERTARETVLSGTIDLEPLPKLAAVLALTDLGYTVDGERIVVRAAK